METFLDVVVVVVSEVVVAAAAVVDVSGSFVLLFGAFSETHTSKKSEFLNNKIRSTR